MNIDISYAEMAFLRDVVSEKRMEIWKTVWLPGLKNKSKEDVDAVYKKVMTNPACWADFPGQQITKGFQPAPVTSDLDCCNFILERFRRKENEIQKTMKK